MMASFRWFFLIGGLMTAGSWAAESAGQYHLNIIHVNDFHARFEQISRAPSGCLCKPGQEATCVGGIARLIGEVRRLKAKNPQALFLNAGDNFQGSIWYNIFKWNATQHFLNMEPADAMALGNHEFDDKVDGLVPFLERIKSPVLAANVDASEEPQIKDKFKPSVIIERQGRKIGIIGLITPQAPQICRTGKLKVSEVLSPVEEEGARMEKEGVNIIIVLSHCGVLEDTELAKKSKYADIIVGGHSHSLLFTGTAPDGETKIDEYPRVVTQEGTNRKVLVVQSGSWTKFLGNLHAYFDDAGNVLSWEGNSIFLDQNVKPAADVAKEVEKWAAEIKMLANEVVGRTMVDISLEPSCHVGECIMANFITDAMVDSLAGKGDADSWTAAAIAVGNAGSFRSPIPKGPITYADLLATVPFGNTVDLVEIQGSAILEAIEHSVTRDSLLHWSGLRVVLDASKKEGSRVVSVTVSCHKCPLPSYSPIDKDTWYPVVTSSYILDKPESFPGLSKYRNRKIGPMDIDILKEHVSKRKAVLKQLDGRLVVLNNKSRAQMLTELKARRIA